MRQVKPIGNSAWHPTTVFSPPTGCGQSNHPSKPEPPSSQGDGSEWGRCRWRGPRVLFFLSLAMCILYVASAQAYTSGITSDRWAGYNEDNGCNMCHGNDSVNAPTVVFNGPTEVNPGETIQISLSVSAIGAHAAAGLNVSADLGTLGVGEATDIRQTTNPDTGRPEITQTGAKYLNEFGVATFSFSWTAPESFLSATLTGWGIAVDLNGESSGDRASRAFLQINQCGDSDGDGEVGILCGGGDCDDTNAEINPGATEICNGLDDDCNGAVDEISCPCGYYLDEDGDGFGAVEAESDSCEDSPPAGYDADGGDCDDQDPTIYEGAEEIPYDGIDQDCDGLDLDDLDGDGFAGGVDGSDCDDENANTNPGATEVADEVDNDCDGLVDEGTVLYDNDGDGESQAEGDCDDSDPAIHSGAAEICGDDVDQNCDGVDLACEEDTPDGDDDTVGDDDDTYVGDDDTAGGDDDTNAGDDDTAGGDDDTNAGDDDTAGGDDDTNAGDDDTDAGDDDDGGASLSPSPSGPADQDSGSCSCSHPGTGGSPMTGVALMLALSGLLWRRRRAPRGDLGT